MKATLVGDIKMVTNVKMKVNEDLSRRVQEIVFAHGGRWLTNVSLTIDGKKVSYTNNPYIYISCNYYDDIVLNFGSDAEYFKNSDEEEISAYDFIASNGEQKWLPKCGEEVLFSDDKVEWKKGIFRMYAPAMTHPFISEIGICSSYCKPLSKKLVFKDFLEENGISFDKFLENCKPENQRWDCIDKYYDDIDELKEYSPVYWITEAFSLEYNMLSISESDLECILEKWVNAVKDSKRNNIEVIWSEDEN